MKDNNTCICFQNFPANIKRNLPHITHAYKKVLQGKFIAVNFTLFDHISFFTLTTSEKKSIEIAYRLVTIYPTQFRICKSL
jgi:hypothetical protein